MSVPPEDNPFAPPPEGSVPPLPPDRSVPPPPPAGSVPPPPPYGAPLPPPAYGSASDYAAPPVYGAAAGSPYTGAENGQGTTALVTGIVGLLCCGLVSIVAIVTGRRGMALADAGRATNRGVAQAGFILGWLGVGLWLLAVIAAFVAAATSSTSSVGAG